MLILTRREGETIQNIRVTILGQKNEQVRVGIEAPKEVPVVISRAPPNILEIEGQHRS